MTASELSDLAHRIESLTGRGRWASIGSLESHRSMQLNRSDLDDLRAAARALRKMDAIEAAIGDVDELRRWVDDHSDTEHAGGVVDPSEAHLQPNDRERPAGVAYDAVSETAENHLPTQPKEQTMKTITVDGVEYAPVTPDDPQVRIVILQRGWVVVGYWSRDGEDVTITSGKVIRRWGTTAGLGELVDGPTADTVLDPAGTVRAHILGVVATIDADADAWGRVL